MPRHLLFCDSLPFWGGGENWIVRTAAALAGRGWRTTVAGRAGSELVRRAGSSGVATVVWPYRRDFDPATIIGASRFIRRQSPDLVVVTTGRDIRTAGLAARRHGLPVVWRMGLKPKPSLIHRLTGEWVVDRVIAPSEYVRRDLRVFPWLRDRITVIPNGIDPVPLPTREDVAAARSRLSWNPVEKIVLYVGRLIHAKGPDVLLRAFADVVRRTENVRLVLVGTGTAREEYQALSRTLGLTSAVTFAGFTDNPADFFTGADLFVLPSRTETFGFVLLEAMGRGKPVAASRTGGIPEVIGEDAGLLVEPENPEKLSETLCRLIRDPELCGRIGGRAAERVRDHFTARGMYDQIESLLTQILDTNRIDSAGPRAGAGSLRRPVTADAADRG